MGAKIGSSWGVSAEDNTAEKRTHEARPGQRKECQEGLWYTSPASWPIRLSPAFHPSTRERRPFVWLERLLLLAFAFCVLVGIGALVVWWQLRSSEQPAIDADPLRSVRTEQISPALALRQLAGDLADGLAYQATQAGELETARAILTYDADLTTAGRAVRLPAIGAPLPGDWSSRWLRHRCTGLLIPAAILDTTLPPLERAQLLAQTAEGLAAVEQPAAALDAARQAQTIAAKTPDLLPAQRSQVFTVLRALAPQLGRCCVHPADRRSGAQSLLDACGHAGHYYNVNNRATRFPTIPLRRLQIQARQQAAALLAAKLAQESSAGCCCRMLPPQRYPDFLGRR